MQDTPTVAIARHFLGLLRGGKPPTDEELAQALDELAIAYHNAPEGSPADEDKEPPREEFRRLYAGLGKRFPNYGLYAVADPTEPLNDGNLVGDAIDDLAEIALDLHDVVWRHENIGPDDAHWHFKFSFRSH